MCFHFSLKVFLEYFLKMRSANDEFFRLCFSGNVLRPPVCVKDGFAGRGLLGLVLFVFQPLGCVLPRPLGPLASAGPLLTLFLAGWTTPFGSF